jgi:ribosomal protein S6
LKKNLSKILVVLKKYLYLQTNYKNQSIMNNYETVFILTPVLSDAQVEEAVRKFEDFLKERNCEIVAKENWGLRKLAYPIQLKKNGFYTLIEFKGEGTIVADLETAFKRDERVIRYLTTKLDKHAVEYAVTRRAKLKASKN